jgi:hypothetical protein
MRSICMAAVLLSLCASVSASGQEVKPLVIVTVSPTGSFVDPKDNPQLDQNVIDALKHTEETNSDLEKLVDLVAKSDSVVNLPEETKAKLEVLILQWVKPIAGSDIDGNLKGYLALSKFRPDNTTYSEKVNGYTAKKESVRKSILTKFKKKVDDFNGITWFTHKNTPRYADSRTYIQLYIGQKSSDNAFLRLEINYTSDDWLFIRSAVANIDGEFVTIPTSEWRRDNDSEIWEWMDVMAHGQYLDIAKRISNSKKTVIRFQGQDYYDDYTVKPEDKEAIRDTLLAFDVLQSEGK